MASTKLSAARRALKRTVARSQPDPATCIYRNVSRLARVVTVAFDGAFATQDLTAAQFNILMSLARLGPISVGSLASKLSMDASTVPRSLAPLVRADLVMVRPGGDRRVRIIELTDAGCERLRLALPIWQQQQRQMLRVLGVPGWNTLRKTLAVVRRAAAQP